MKTLDEARKGWQELNLGELRRLRSEDEHAPQLQGLRSVAWKECLLFDTSDKGKWPQRLSESRSAYNALRQHFLRALQHPDELGSAIDPLTEDNESPWEALRRDEAIRAEIFQDVERCIPENIYFRQPATQSMLLDILFIFSKLNPDVGYRQGMHELVAPIVWVVERDALDMRHWRKTDIEDAKDDKLLADLLDQRYIEHDAFTLFCLIMQNAKAFYEPGSGAASKSLSPLQAGAAAETPILARINRIYGRLLPRYDPELAAHLAKLDVVPQVFLMRWMRLLFGREFPFDDTLGIWDQLFASDPSLDLVDFICVAMIIRIRWDLLEADANDILRLMLQYPDTLSTSTSNDLVLDALVLKRDRTAAAGARVISRRTGRSVAVVSDISERPVTPTGDFPPTMGSPNRAPSPLRSPSRFPTPINPVMGLEGLLSDAARAAYSRGEKWGLSRAVRDAVGDVRKNLAAFNASPRNSLRRRTSSADIMRKAAQLEARNKALAKMLETALAELWECQRHQVERQDESSDPTEKSATDALGVAIAKVQFVHVYLNDQSLPLPIDETTLDTANAAANRSSLQHQEHRAPTGASGSIEADPAETAEPPPPLAREKANVEQESLDSKSSDRSGIGDELKTPEHQNTQPSRALDATLQSDPHQRLPAVNTTPAPDVVSDSSPRPSLEQSSFSWMLGHQSADRQHAFASASPFTDEASLTSRIRPTGKGFLFGVDDDDSATGTEERSRRGSQEEAKKGRRRTNVLRKKATGSSRGGEDSEASKRRNSAAGEPGADDIGLNAL